ncbi:hypothetical protein ON010_g12676 [Phytophthora cinnamomi]|nr:hypothetical protein ON010_g12676 [Phytophthora cinnamomi]
MTCAASDVPCADTDTDVVFATEEQVHEIKYLRLHVALLQVIVTLVPWLLSFPQVTSPVEQVWSLTEHSALSEVCWEDVW